MAGEWKPSYIHDTGDSASTLDFVAPADWQLLSVYVHLTTTATVGDRLMTLVLYSDSAAGAEIDRVRAGALQVASTDWHYHFAPGLARLTSVYDSDQITSPMPNWILRRGQMLRVLDGAAIAADSDNISVAITGMIKGSLWGDTQAMQGWPSA